ncbi:retrovirus-related pol polyprotein LINE-1 [Tanacetum coccineum]
MEGTLVIRRYMCYNLGTQALKIARYGVGVILRADLKDKVVHVNRCSDKIVSLTLVIKGETVNVISVYAPQVGLRATTEGYSGVHRGFGYEVRNEEGDLKACKDYKVFLGEACSSQHRFLAMDTLFKRVQRRRVGSTTSRILWKNLNGDERRRSDQDAKIPEEWRHGGVIHIFKNKGDAQVCGNYMGIKLLSHTMKLWERVIERRLQRETTVSENQFSFMLGRSSIEAIHLIRSLMEKYKERQRDLQLAFLDLEKAYDSIPRELI